jgi:hypothetical protein
VTAEEIFRTTMTDEKYCLLRHDTCCFLIGLLFEDRGSTFFHSVGEHLPDYIMLHPEDSTLSIHHLESLRPNIFLFCFVAGLCGFFPIHPRSYMYGWRSRRAAEIQAATEAAKSEEQKKE